MLVVVVVVVVEIGSVSEFRGSLRSLDENESGAGTTVGSR